MRLKFEKIGPLLHTFSLERLLIGQALNSMRLHCQRFLLMAASPMPSRETFWSGAARRFRRNADNHWNHLSRFTNLLVILNISMFFLTELVTKQSYYYTFYSLLCLGIVYAGLLLPLGFLHRLGYYLLFLLIEGVGLYFLVISVWYWVVTNRIAP